MPGDGIELGSVDFEDGPDDFTFINKLAQDNPTDDKPDILRNLQGAADNVTAERAFRCSSDDEQNVGMVQRSGSMITLPPQTMTAMSVVALFQSHDEEGLNSEQVARKLELNGPNTMAINTTCCAWCPCACCPMRNPCAGGQLPITLPETCQVVRDAETKRIPITQLVPGDLVLITPGKIIPADLRIITDDAVITMDNSVLTGDATPVTRDSEPDLNPKEQIHSTNLALCGTTCLTTSEPTTGIVFATGMLTQCALHVLQAEEEQPPKHSCVLL